jgi:glycosyltransferase involved in cell wall biosynthesis
MKNKVIAIIPALNEEKTIEKVLKNTRKFVSEIIVIDDGSFDRTAKISKKYATVIKNKKNIGYDDSLNIGFIHAKLKKANIVITLDADDQHLAKDIPLLINPIINKKFDIVIGKRPYKARFMEHVFGNYGYKKGINDPLCGLKAYNIRVYNDIGFFDNIKSIGTQLMFIAIKKGYKIKEVDIKINKRIDTPRFGKQIQANIKLLIAYLKLRYYLLFYK